ncbi:MAG: FAD-binding protein, partial [Bacilli bacterium]
TIFEGEMAIDLLMQDNRCVGVWTKNEQGDRSYFLAPHTILATGGVGGIYSITSNDPTITGDGMAMAYRAGAQLEDMEFVQFHPTMLSVHGKGCGLISEAVRGEGAKLVTGEGRLLMEGVHEQKDLAPRDVVAREIHYALLRKERVYLDIAGVKHFCNRFPTISTICKDNGVEIERGYIPVGPGAHFMMGGVKTDMSGQTTVEGLYAIGEVAHTGVHGANRLASNSLLEAIVFANEVAKTIMSKHVHVPITFHDPIVSNNLTINLPTVIVIQRMLTDYVGIILDEKGLQLARKWLEQFLPFIDSMGNMVLPDSLEHVQKVNMLTVGWLITTSALIRQESRGGHYRSDFPKKDNKWIKKRTIRRREPNEHHQTTPVVAAISN